LPADIAFRDRERAAQTLARVAERVPAVVAQTLAPLLAESPDPDSALNGFERLSMLAGPELFRLMERHRELVHYALAVFAYSQWLGETLIQNPDLFQVFLREKNLERTHSREEFHEALARFRSRWLENDVALLLARFKRREYVRIMLRDVLGIATLAETTAEISALADVLIEEAVRVCDAGLRERYGAPQHRDAAGRLLDAPFAVLSLGKLGGNELNYSSDVDLLYLYGDGEDAGTAAISNREYFIRLGQQITGLLSRMTGEGAVFRIDLRLRPQGGEGEPAVGLAHALQYYAYTALDWELQAMIKLRYSAGDRMLARAFVRGVQPIIYGATLNFEAIETALDTRDRMLQRRRRAAARGLAHSLDVKLDRGGIRDIEFLMQCLQRVYGGPERWLRSGGTMFSLQKLHDKRHLTGKEFHELSTAYEFLRKIEHRLQLRSGQQTHRLPESAEELRILYRAAGVDETGQYSPSGIVEMVRARMRAVAEIYERIIHHQQLQHQREEAAFEFHLASTLFAPGREASEAQVLERLAADAPEIHRIVQRAELSLPARRDLNRFLASAFTSSDRYAALARSPQAVERALRLFGVSDYLTDILVRHPEEIAALEEVGDARAAAAELFQAGAPPSSSADPIFEYLGSSALSYGEKLGLLRRHYRHRVFLSGARDVMELRTVGDSLAETSAAAEAAVGAALAIAGQPDGFAVLALGRLGTREFDLLSDADLLFVRDEKLDLRAAVHTAEQVVEALSAYTRDGTVFPVDTRLRPRGAEGELIVTPPQLDSYFAGEAQAWEALTYTKLRLIAGSAAVGASVLAARDRFLARFAADPDFVAAVRDMRAKLEKSDGSPRHLKTAPGGLYDIDFIAAATLVRHRIAPTAGSLRQRLQALAARNLLSREDAAALAAAAEFLRTLEHLARLATGRARKTLPIAGHARHTVEELAAKILHRDFPHGLDAALDETFTTVREIYERVVV
jgi:glutamate-ammonia-ligase adenylyltransferase